MRSQTPLLGKLHAIDLVACVLLIACVVASWAPRSSGPIDVRWDAGVYYVLGTALAEDRGYKLLYEPGEIDATQYPPLLPAIVAAHQRLVGSHDVESVGPWLRRSWFLLSSAYVLLCYGLACRFVTRPFAFGVALVCALNPYAIFYSNLCFPEIPFMVVSVTAVLCLGAEDGRLRSAAFYFFAALAFLLRTVGMALLGAWFAEALAERRYKTAGLRLVLASLPILVWQGYIHRVESSPQYAAPAYEYQRAPYLFRNVDYATNVFSFKNPVIPDLGAASTADIASRVAGNVRRLPLTLTELFVRQGEDWRSSERAVAEWLFGAPRSVVRALLRLPGWLLVAAIVFQFVRRRWLTALYVTAYLAIIALTPWPNQNTRYLAPLVPFLLIALAEIPCAFSGRGRTAAKAAIGAVLLGILIVQSILLGARYRTGFSRVMRTEAAGASPTPLFQYSPAFDAWDHGMAWLKQHAERGAIVAAAMPEAVFLQTGLKAVMPPFVSDPVEAERLLDSVPVEYLVVDSFASVVVSQRYGAPLVRSLPHRWKPVYREPQGGLDIYQRVSGD